MSRIEEGRKSIPSTWNSMMKKGLSGCSRLKESRKTRKVAGGVVS